VLVALSAVALSAPAAAAGKGDAKLCVAAADEGQKLRDEGKLAAAKEKFIACAAKSCPGAVATECTTWLEEVERDIPTVSFRAKDEAGKEILDVRVFVDGAAFAETIVPKASPMDPGAHKIRFERADGKTVEESVIVRTGEKNRIVELSFRPAKDAIPGGSTNEPPRSAQGGRGFVVPWVAWVGLGVGVLGGVGTAVFAVMANSDEDHLRQTCAPNCPESERGAIETKVALANVSLFVGIAGLGTAIVSTIVANVMGKPDAPPKTGLVVAPTQGGAQVGLVGRF
jgi:hypothetical protein